MPNSIPSPSQLTRYIKAEVGDIGDRLAFLRVVAPRLAKHYVSDPNWWWFGPWWFALREVLTRYSGLSLLQGGDRPDYLARYDLHDDFLNYAAAFWYRDRYGLIDLTRPHEIVLPDGKEVRYDPRYGIL